MNKQFKVYGMLLALLLAFGSVACTVEQTEEGNLPEYEVTQTEEGELPEYDVDAVDVDIEEGEETVTVPDVDVDMEEKEITVPEIEINEEDDGDGEPNAN